MRMRWLAALLFAGGLAAGLGVDLTATAHASGSMRPEQPRPEQPRPEQPRPEQPRPGQPWNEISLPLFAGQGGALCVDVPGRTTAPGAPLRLTRCHGYAPDGAPQRWYFPGGRFQKVSNTNSGLCIGFPGGGAPVTGARLVQERCDRVPGWQLVPQGRDGTDPLSVPAASGPGGPALCMAAAGLGDAGATRLVALPCAGFRDAGRLLELR